MWRSIHEGLFEVVKPFARFDFMRALAKNHVLNAKDNWDFFYFRLLYLVTRGVKPK